MSTPDPITVGSSTVTDAFVDFNLTNASPPQLHVELDQAIERESTIYPLGTHDCESIPTDGEYWLGYGDGLYERYKNGPVGVPADEVAAQ